MIDACSLFKRSTVALLLAVGFSSSSAAQEPMIQMIPFGDDFVIESQEGLTFRMIDQQLMLFVDLLSAEGRFPVSLFLEEGEFGDEGPQTLALHEDVLLALRLADKETTITLSGPDEFVLQVPVERIRKYEASTKNSEFLTRNAADFEGYPFAGSMSWSLLSSGSDDVFSTQPSDFD